MSGMRVFGLFVLAAAVGAGGLAGGWWLRERQQELRLVDGETKVDRTGPRGGIEEAFAKWSSAPELEGALLGFCVLDEQGGLLYGSPLAGTALCPASALKTVTTGAAFGTLGPEFRFKTEILADVEAAEDGRIVNGFIAGDLVLKGSGDPTLEAEDIAAMAERLVKRGLQRVGGSIRADASVFTSAAVNDHWNWGDIGNAYGAGAFGINVGHNVMTMSFDPGTWEGESAKFLGSIPSMKAADLDVEVTTGAAGSGDGVMIYSSPVSEVIQARGTVPLGERGFTVRGALPNPPQLAAAILKSALEKRGVVIAGRVLASKNSVRLLETHESAALPEIIDHLHEVSDNLEAQCLFLTMGNAAKADPALALKGYWERAGVSFRSLRLIDGSGLARAAMIRPLDLAKVNHLARHAAHGERFLQSLSASQGGAIRSKRGAMSGVRTEVGFVSRGGREFVFALMANGLPAGVDFWKLRTELLDAIGR